MRTDAKPAHSSWFCNNFSCDHLINAYFFFFFLFIDAQSGMVHRGPVKNRSCTDIFCLVIFIAFLVGWGIIGFYGNKQKSNKCDALFKLTYKNLKSPHVMRSSGLLLFSGKSDIVVVVVAFYVLCALKKRRSDRYFYLCGCQDSRWAIRNASSIPLTATEKHVVLTRQSRISRTYSILIWLVAPILRSS